VGIGELRVTQPSEAGSKLTWPVLSAMGSRGGCDFSGAYTDWDKIQGRFARIPCGQAGLRLGN
jgi:hypothetical protein